MADAVIEARMFLYASTAYFALAHASGWDFGLSPPLLTAVTT